MINIDPYIQRLEWLKEWISLFVDAECKLPASAPGKARILRGSMTVMAIFSFDEYCAYKQFLKINQHGKDKEY
jgi:hypothetical protein